MKKIFILFISVFLFTCCYNPKTDNSVDTRKESVIKTDSNAIGYYIYWDRHKDVDVRMINIEGHKYIVATSYIGRGSGGVDIEHSESCECKNK